MVRMGRMDHHCQVDAVEGAPADHELLAATPLFGGCAEDCDTTAERLGDLGDGQPGTKTGGADDVVPAGVADTGKRVVLAQHGSLHVYILYLIALKEYFKKSSILFLNLYILQVDTYDLFQKRFDHRLKMLECQRHLFLLPRRY